MEKQPTSQGTTELDKSSSGKKQKRKLPAPSFASSKAPDGLVNDPSLHQGRKRARPHVDGDWPTHIYIPIKLEAKSKHSLGKVVTQLSKEDQSKVWHSLIHSDFEEFSLHLSLSRPLFLKTNERDNFINQMKKFISGIKLFEIYFSAFSNLMNDDCTRGFLALEVGNGHSDVSKLFYSSILNELLKEIDKVLEMYCQPKYYENPRFHVSIAWCLINQENIHQTKHTSHHLLSSSLLQSLNDIQLDEIRNIPWKVDYFNVVIGKTIHQITLG
ncbi:uncharacterized protein VP01_2030g2 [Puccinia sorghi]|uniref:U6 snRNA phosphodiesterase 1 n=1 Tax=Puccinia sorghi TaxID=27349 RepID=A0A0L6VCX7_9BASI|nr:uncharacterized protein VP01_2030g2 [Puccinia sorghi]